MNNKHSKLSKWKQFRLDNFQHDISPDMPGPASAVEELQTTEGEDPGSTPDDGS
jgi:hypothetical protein